MPRLPYLPADLDEPPELVRAIRARRGGDLLHLDRQLLRSPPLAGGWNHMMGAVRRELLLDARLRELAILAVARLNDAGYEFFHHAPDFERAGGRADQLAALDDIERALEQTAIFDPSERAVLRLTLESTRQVKVSDATFNEVREALGDDRQVFELVATVAAYNMVSRVLVALGIEPES